MNTASKESTKDGVSVVVPCYNEEGSVAETYQQIKKSFLSWIEDGKTPLPFEIIFVNDGSSDDTEKILRKLVAEEDHLQVLNNPTNLGYGASLKRGITKAIYDRIVITDADGTYPNDRIPEFAEKLTDCDMLIGARVGKNAHIPLVRRPAKWLLLRYARWMARAPIEDLNSGLRAMWKQHIERFLSLLPNGFSFTSTITLAMHVNGMAVRYEPIDYAKRVGKSSIRPIRDTFNFFSLVLRTIMYFRPLQVLGTIAILLIIASLGVGIAGNILTGQVPDVITTSLFSTGVIFLGLGLLGDLINAQRR